MEHPIFAEALEELVTIGDFIRWGMSRFNEAGLWFGHGNDDAWDEAVTLVQSALHLDPETGPEIFSTRLTGSEKQEILELFSQRIEKRIPAAYITNKAHFADLEFFVDERVLVPRSPIAELIMNEFKPWLDPEQVDSVLELGTGSGCIAVACTLAFPDADIDAVDISPDALEVAAINVDTYDAEDQVELIESDMFNALGEREYDLIIANPPYVDQDEYDELPKEYEFEPKSGLVAGDDGLEFAVRILQQAGEYLRDDGVLIVEVGSAQAALEERYPDAPFVWLEFERGGEGVFLLTAEQLRSYTF